MNGHTDIYSLDLKKLSKIAGVPQAELVEGLKVEHALELAGGLVHHGNPNKLISDDATFEGFVVGVDRLVVHSGDCTHATETTALLPSLPHKVEVVKRKFKMATRIIGRLKMDEKHSVERKKANMLRNVVTNDFTLAIPAAHSGDKLGLATATPVENNAYLISMTHASSEKEFLLAVRGNPPTGKSFAQRLRSMSTLPSDVRQITVETVHQELQAPSRHGVSSHQHPPHLQVQIVVEKQVPFIGYVLLISALLTISSLGAALDLQKGVDPFVKLFWRTTASVLGFTPFAIYSVYAYGWPSWNRTLCRLFFLCCLSYALFLMTFLWSLQHTSIGHAYIFNNCHSLMIVVGKCLLGKPVLLFEAIGSGLGILGGVVTTMDHGNTSSPSNSSSSSSSDVIAPSWQGDLVALVGAIGGVFYLLSAKKLRKEIDVFLLMTMLFIVTAVLHFPLFWLRQMPITWSTNDSIGLMGWLSPRQFLIELYLVFICTIIGTLGYISVMKYFDPIVVSVVMLLEPVLAIAIGVAAGVDHVPGRLTWLGGLLVIIGTCFVVLAANKKTDIHDATSAMDRATSTFTPKTAIYHCKVSNHMNIDVTSSVSV
jgi:drug/metabolite transporter (DMT)-like permease